jgi:hypothetical protein
MAQLSDERGNEFKGVLDGITNQTMVDGRAATASLSIANATAVVDLNGVSVVAVDVRGTFVGTLVFEATVDGTNFVQLPGINALTNAFVNTITTTAQTVMVGCTGFRQFRVRASAYTSGAMIVALRASMADYAIVGIPLPTPLHVTNTAAVNTAVTATLPAAGAGLFHYITRIFVKKYFATAGLAAATPQLVTSTNLPGSRVMSFSTAGALGSTAEETIANALPIKSTTANTATTIVCPAATDAIWRVSVDYYVGAR